MSRKLELNLDAKWLLIGVVLVISVIVTMVANTNHNKQDATSVVEGTIDVDDGDLKINWNRFTYHDIELSDNLTIASSGVYHLTGSLTDKNIVINTIDGKVKLILDNVTIKNSNGPAIACHAADDLVIELVGENVLEDGETYATNYDEDVKGAIYSKDDLTLQGDGTLRLTANYADGIVGKDDVKFNSGTYKITAADDGIRGKDSVYIVGGDFEITAKGDAIKSTNETTVGKGFVLIKDGTLNLTATAKGIKAINSILIYGGDFTINSTDDAIHTNNYIGITDGKIVISAGDDGIHADKKLIIENGSIDIKKSYEGLEAKAITINGGDISIISSDDGLNAGGGSDGSANNRPGAGAFDSDTECIIAINGGNIYVNASGDGIDSNGHIYFNGGTVSVDGPTNNGNGALDGGVSITQNGGTVVAVGASGMAETLGQDSGIYNASIYFSSTLAAGTEIKIKNAGGTTIVRHTSAKTFNHMSVGTPEFKSGETYTIYVNGTEYDTFTISSTVTTVGSGANNFNSGMPGNMPSEMPNGMPGEMPDGTSNQMQPGQFDQSNPPTPPSQSEQSNRADQTGRPSFNGATKS